MRIPRQRGQGTDLGIPVEAAVIFEDRDDAGQRLAEALSDYRGRDVVVLGLPRGGVPVAAEVARTLTAPLDVIVVRKLGVPFAPELAMGAIGEGGVRVLNAAVIRDWKLSSTDVDHVEARERAELDARVHRFRDGRPPVSVVGRTAVVVDDGVATGATARAACEVVRALGAREVVLAAPVASPRAIADLERVADRVVCLESPQWFSAVGQAYRDFAQVSDDEVVDRLEAERSRQGSGDVAPEGDPSLAVEEDVEVQADVRLPGLLTLPAGARAVVLFVHGSGSSRHSPRNQQVARRLNRAGLGTLLFDLLTPEEAQDRDLVFAVDLLGARLLQATAWLRRHLPSPAPAVGYFGASTGAAAALWAAADPAARIGAVVSRGGRPDLAAPRLHLVRAPTLLIVGGADEVVLGLNRRAAAMLPGEVRLEVVPGAGHLFEQPGELETVADLAARWFTRYLHLPA